VYTVSQNAFSSPSAILANCSNDPPGGGVGEGDGGGGPGGGNGGGFGGGGGGRGTRVI
jgi:hypothetical protein